MFWQISVCSIFRYLVSSVSQSLHLFFVISSYFPFLLQSACDKSSHCQNNATCQSGFTLKGYRCLCPPGFKGESCETGISLSQHLKWCIWEIFIWFSMLVWQLSFSCWKWREFVSLYIVLNLSKRKFLIIFYCVHCFLRSIVCIFSFDTFPWQNESSSNACRMFNIVTVRIAQK